MVETRRSEAPALERGDLGIAIEGLSKDLGEFRLREVTLDIPAEEYFVLLGPTGAGKTIFVECVAGLLRPDSGSIFLAGADVTNLRPEERRVGYVPQDYALFQHLTVWENIAFGLRARRAPRYKIKQKVEALSEMLHITHLLHRRPLRLSGGEQQRVALARALAIEPDVLLMDEPLSALDETTRAVLCRELVQTHQQLGTTTIHVSHNFEETLAVATLVGIIHQGEIQQVGTPSEVFYAPQNEFVARFVGMSNVLAAEPGPVSGTANVAGKIIHLAHPIRSPSFVTIRPEDVSVQVAEPDGEPVNLFAASVVETRPRGVLLEVSFDAGFPVVTLMTPKQWAALRLDIGGKAHVQLHPEDLNTFPRETK